MSSRGCGDREEGGLYLCTTTSIYGLPLEHFLVDPPLEWKGGSVRAPMLVQGGDGTKHVLLGIGETYYPTVASFVEEAKVMGVSKKIPVDFDLSQIEVGKSKFLLMHPKAIPTFMYDIGEDLPCIKTKCSCNICQDMEDNHERHHNKGECIGNLWPLASYVHRADVHEIHELDPSDRAHIVTPSASFWVKVPQIPRYKTSEHKECPFCGSKRIEMVTPKGKKGKVGICLKCEMSFHPKVPYDSVHLHYASGIVLNFPRFHLEYINAEGKVPPDLKERVEGTLWRLDVCPE